MGYSNFLLSETIKATLDVSVIISNAIGLYPIKEYLDRLSDRKTFTDALIAGISRITLRSFEPLSHKRLPTVLEIGHDAARIISPMIFAPLGPTMIIASYFAPGLVASAAELTLNNVLESNGVIAEKILNFDIPIIYNSVKDKVSGIVENIRTKGSQFITAFGTATE